MQNATAFQPHLLNFYAPSLGDPLVLEARVQSGFSFLITSVHMKIKQKINQTSVFQYCGPS